MGTAEVSSAVALAAADRPSAAGGGEPLARLASSRPMTTSRGITAISDAVTALSAIRVLVELG